MVNYHNPATIESDFSTYAFLSDFSGLQPDLLVCLFNSGAREALARRGWHIYVSLIVLPR